MPVRCASTTAAEGIFGLTNTPIMVLGSAVSDFNMAAGALTDNSIGFVGEIVCGCAVVLVWPFGFRSGVSRLAEHEIRFWSFDRNYFRAAQTHILIKKK
jgi:hypothetical protein